MTTIEAIEAHVGLPFLDHQREALQDALDQVAQGAWLRLCLYHRTGAGKTYTALAAALLGGATEALVLAPPVTHDAWRTWGRRVGVDVTPISHATFRKKDFKVTRDQTMIVDEFHLLGGQTGTGWKKLDKIAAGLQAPLVIASATPNYNDAERVYCIGHVLDPIKFKGGYLGFLYRECITRENPFAKIPYVDGFRRTDGKEGIRTAEEYLSTMDKVHYVEDETIKQVTIADVSIDIDLPDEFERYGLDRRRGRIIASQMEERHARKRLLIIGEDGLIRPEVYEEIAHLVGQVTTPTLIFSNSAVIAEALHNTAQLHRARAALVTGKTPTKAKQELIHRFIFGAWDVLIGTATLATGTDGIDKMCDHLLIVDDTDDDSLRRQLMGRILPRGLDSDVSKKVVTRLVFL